MNGSGSKQFCRSSTAISNDETGITEDPDVRFEVAKHIVNHARTTAHAQGVVVDLLVMPIGALAEAGAVCSRSCAGCTRSSRSTRPAGPPTSASACPTATSSAPRSCRWREPGMTSAIINPLHLEEMQGVVLGADVMLGKDEHCRRWLTRFREAPAEGSAAAAAAGARGERRRRREGVAGEPHAMDADLPGPAAEPSRLSDRPGGRRRHSSGGSLGCLALPGNRMAWFPMNEAASGMACHGTPGAGPLGGALLL